MISLAASAGLGTTLHGYNAGVISHVIANDQFNTYYQTDSKTGIIGAIVSIFAGGATIGSLASGFLLDSYGRKKTIQIGAVISIIGVMLQAASVRLEMILAGRSITGFAVGVMSVGVPVYLAECASPKSRGFLVGFTQFMLVWGFVASSWVGYASHDVPYAAENPFTWRFPIALAAIPAVFIGFALQWLPESPRYLVRRGVLDQAFRALMKLHHDGENSEILRQEIQDIANQWKRELQVMPGSSDWVVMFKVPQWRSRVINAALPSLFTQLTGINIITYYQNQMYTGLGVTEKGALFLSAIYSLVAPISTFLFMIFIVDRYGRRLPLLIASCVLPLLFIVFAILSSQNLDGSIKTLSTAGITIIFLYNAVFSASFGPLSWIYIAEVVPLRLRGKGNAVGVAIGNWAVNVVISQVSPEALDDIGWKYYIAYVVFMLAITLPTCFFVIRDPNGLPLEQVAELWQGEREPLYLLAPDIELVKRPDYVIHPTTVIGAS